MKRQNNVTGIQPEVMRWARQSIGMTIPDVAQRLKKSVEEITNWENGSAFPSYSQLEKLAYEIYKRPIAVFFLPVPPQEILPTNEFRTLPEADLNSLLAHTYLRIRHAHAFQLALKELFFNQNPLEKCIWRELSLSLTKPIVAQAELVRSYLGISLQSQVEWKSDELALKIWRQAIEEAGIFVFKDSFKQKDISGFCILDDEFPLIYLNNSTTKTRQIFSLLHELTHLLLGMNGLDKRGEQYVENLPQAEKKIEKFCNAISAEILIPTLDFQTQTNHLPRPIEQVPDEEFANLAQRYGVSREAILRRFLDQDRVSRSFYEKKAKEWASQTKKRTGGDWYASQNTYLSNKFAQEVVSRYYSNQININQAADFLGIKAKNFAGLEQLVLKGAL